MKDARLIATKLGNIIIGNHKIFVNLLRLYQRQALGVHGNWGTSKESFEEQHKRKLFYHI